MPDGELSAGTYSAVGFAPRVVFTVPDGWFAASDIGWADEDEAQVAITLLLGEVDDPDVSLNLVYPEPGRLMDGWKEWDERRNVIPFAADFATWVDDHPHLELLGATPIDIGGVAGTSVDFRVTSLQTENLPPMCGECLPTFPITLRNQTGPLGNDLFAGAGLGSLERWMVLPTDEGTVVLQYWSYSRRGLDTVAAALEPVLETMEIGS